jgi:hypothetical protein
MSFDFSVGADGTYPYTSNIDIEAHPNATISLTKETSTQLVKCYQGTFTGDSSGTLNLTTIDNDVTGLAKQNGYEYSIGLEGEILNNQINGYFEEGSFTGTLTDDTFNGTWQNAEPESGTWTGTRTL